MSVRRRGRPAYKGVRADRLPLMREFVQWGIRRRRWVEVTVENYCRSTLRFHTWCVAEGFRPERMTPDRILAFLDTVHPTVAAYMHYHCALKAWFQFLLETGRVDRNPMERVPRQPVKRSLPRAVERDEAGRILDAARAHGGVKWELYIALMLFGGLRRNEARQVEWSHLERDPEGRQWLYVLGKGGFERMVPVHPELQRLFAAWCAESHHPRFVFPGTYRGTSISLSCASKHTRAILDDAGFSEVTGHALRHTFATRLIEQGVDVPAVAEALGHQTLSSTTIYTRARPARVGEAVRGLDFRRSPSVEASP